MDYLNALYEKLVKISMINIFGENSPNIKNVSLSESEVYKLLSYSSMLALSTEDDDVIKSYEIISRAVEVYGDSYSRVLASSDFILSRIGNFPGRELLRKRFLNGDSPKLNFSLALERIARETENIIDGDIPLTDFQFNLFTLLNKKNVLSFSAPTSAGKSFVLSLDIVRRIKKHNKECVVYIVPTRALISEVSAKLRQSFYDEGMKDVAIRTVPSAIEVNNIRNGLIYVLTQERLSSLISDGYGKEFFINSLVVDEAHEIQKGKRGIILQNAIETVIDLYPNVSLLFSSPLIKNPEYFIELFKVNGSSSFFIENVSPVSQNVILASPIKNKIKQANISCLYNGGRMDLGSVNLDFSFRGGAKDTHPKFAKFISKGEDAIIIFSDGPANAENVAIELASLCDDFELTDSLHEFVEFIKSEIHENYSLAYCLSYGVGYHYGDMPAIIRTGIEQLFKSGDIKYIVCTSTLLQGVNLPAKHIIVENPYSGREPMRRSDFLNLSGRAGRLLKEFHGNVWCISPDKWDVKSFEGNKLQEITSAMSNVMYDGGEIILNLIDNIHLEGKDKELAEVAYAKLYHEIKDNDISAPYSLGYDLSGDPAEILEYNFEHIRKMTVTVPTDILRVHKTVRPEHLQYLYDFLISLEDVRELKLFSPMRAGGKACIDRAIEIIRDIFDWRITERQAKFVSMLAYQWMTGVTMARIIAYHVNRDKGVVKPDNVDEDKDGFITFQKRVTRVVRRVLKALETHVRYELVRYLSIYRDVLVYVLKVRGYEEDADKIEDIAAYLEFGSCDATVLNIMSLGMSRTTAIILSKKIKFGAGLSADQCLEIIKKHKLSALGLPMLCHNEVYELVRVS